ncbi:MAG: RDD family protein [Pigmentiphaga sp.]
MPPRSPSPTRPSRWRLFACMLYEGVLLFGVVFLADYLFDTITQSTHALMWRHLRQLWLFVAIGAYFVISWRYGQTLPMKTWHLRLHDAQGRIPGVGRRMARYTLAWIPVLAAAGLVWLLHRSTGLPAINLLIVFTPFAGFVWSWFDRDGLFLHDRLLGTRLVSTR